MKQKKFKGFRFVEKWIIQIQMRDYEGNDTEMSSVHADYLGKIFQNFGRTKHKIVLMKIG